MRDTKVTTVIVNSTKQGLAMKVGYGNCFARLTSVKEGGEYLMQIDVNWTYQEFLVQDKSNVGNHVFLNSDDCCDYERITIKEKSDGRLEMETLLRKQYRGSKPCSVILEEPDVSAIAGHPTMINFMSSWKTWLSKFVHHSHS